jgi:SAM-dependent methyltransferase
MNEILEGYAAAATPSLIARFEAFDFRELYAPVFDLLPTNAVRAADIGAGTGRDAAWLAGQGHEIWAVEPVKELRDAGAVLHPTDRIKWLDDRLPDLAKLQACGCFDLVLLNGVWQHIDDAARHIAMMHLGAMVTTGGLMVMSLRHGPGAAGRPVFPVSVSETVDAAAHAGLAVLRQTEAGSIQPGNQAKGVHWTWLAFRKTS